MQERGIEAAVEAEVGSFFDLPSVPSSKVGDASLVVAFGGDGTLIRAAHLCAAAGTPILGVYFGRFGFVTQCTFSELGACLSAFIDGKARLETRMMVRADLLRAGQAVAAQHALNEIVLQRSVTSRMMTFSVQIDDRRLTAYPADGIMLSTPTGSTGYNLSAGGPIVDPNVQALLMTALAPHTLSARTLVLRPDSIIRLKVISGGDSVLSADGQSRLHLLEGDEIVVTRSDLTTKLVSVEQDDFLMKLGERLFWSRSAFGESS